ncbi:hypothetical protein B296_00021705 [Ensete ventricosum]|uniref:Secreted protein n=1 Tax=Ensete ventricosum TaxID=4639 RepID=A0A426ZA03_ENSVE|nr:hypothetical protein B296_00021705 [Ensete ventricosum]
MAVFRVKAIVLTELVVLRPVLQLSVTLQRVGCPQEPLLLDLEEDFHLSGVQWRRWRSWMRWLWSVRPPPHGFQRLPTGLLGVGPFVVLTLPHHQCLGDRVLVGTLEHLQDGHRSESIKFDDRMSGSGQLEWCGQASELPCSSYGGRATDGSPLSWRPLGWVARGARYSKETKEEASGVPKALKWL